MAYIDMLKDNDFRQSSFAIARGGSSREDSTRDVYRRQRAVVPVERFKLLCIPEKT